MSFTSLITDPRVYNVTKTPKDIIENILVDVQDKRIMTFEQCLDCRKRSLECARCKFENSQLSLVEMQELKIFSDNLWVEQVPGKPGFIRIRVDYPLNDKIETLYAPEKSSSSQQKRSTKALFRKLEKAGLTAQFHEQITKSVEDGHIEILSNRDAEIILQRHHCFSGINYQCKASSKTQKLRGVTNSSSYHVRVPLTPTAPKVVI